jgi:4-hydroxy-3-methylbut-2-enyl diphosphate reductase IspH
MRIRYENLIKLKGADLLIVIGDKYSNNVDQLVNLANSHQIKTQLITNVDDVKVNIFKNIKHLAITSGTSVDLKYVQTIVKKIKTTV